MLIKLDFYVSPVVTLFYWRQKQTDRQKQTIPDESKEWTGERQNPELSVAKKNIYNFSRYSAGIVNLWVRLNAGEGAHLLTEKNIIFIHI